MAINPTYRSQAWSRFTAFLPCVFLPLALSTSALASSNAALELDGVNDRDAPARIKATVKSGARLSNVIVDKESVLEPGVSIGEGVVLESLDNIPPGTDLSSLTDREDGALDLASTELPGTDANPLTLIDRVRQLESLQEPGTSAEQEPTRGSLDIKLANTELKALPRRVIKAESNAEEGIFFDEDGNIRMIVSGPLEIIAYPEFTQESPIKVAVETYDEKLSMAIQEDGDFIIERILDSEAAEEAVRFTGRPGLSAINVTESSSSEGWRFYPSDLLINVDRAAS